MSLMQFAPFFYASLLVRLFMGTANICLHLERFDPKELPYVSYQNRNNSWGLNISRFYHGLSLYADILPLAIAQGKTNSVSSYN